MRYQRLRTIFITAIVATATILFASLTDAATMPACSGGVSTFTDQSAVGTLTVGAFAGCNLLIERLTGVTDISMTGALTAGTNVTIRNIECTDTSTANKGCVHFSATVSGAGHILIEHIHRTSLAATPNNINAAFAIVHHTALVDGLQSYTFRHASITGTALLTGTNKALDVGCLYFASTVQNIGEVYVDNVSVAGDFQSLSPGSTAYVRVYALRTSITNTRTLSVINSSINGTQVSSLSRVFVSVFQHNGPQLQGGDVVGSSLVVSGNTLTGTFNAELFNSKVNILSTAAISKFYTISIASNTITAVRLSGTVSSGAPSLGIYDSTSVIASFGVGAGARFEVIGNRMSDIDVVFAASIVAIVGVTSFNQWDTILIDDNSIRRVNVSGSSAIVAVFRATSSFYMVVATTGTTGVFAVRRNGISDMTFDCSSSLNIFVVQIGATIGRVATLLIEDMTVEAVSGAASYVSLVGFSSLDTIDLNNGGTFTARRVRVSDTSSTSSPSSSPSGISVTQPEASSFVVAVYLVPSTAGLIHNTDTISILDCAVDISKYNVLHSSSTVEFAVSKVGGVTAALRRLYVTGNRLRFPQISLLAAFTSASIVSFAGSLIELVAGFFKAEICRNSLASANATAGSGVWTTSSKVAVAYFAVGDINAAGEWSFCENQINATEGPSSLVALNRDSFGSYAAILTFRDNDLNNNGGSASSFELFSSVGVFPPFYRKLGVGNALNVRCETWNSSITDSALTNYGTGLTAVDTTCDTSTTAANGSTTTSLSSTTTSTSTSTTSITTTSTTNATSTSGGTTTTDPTTTTSSSTSALSSTATTQTSTTITTTNTPAAPTTSTLPPPPTLLSTSLFPPIPPSLTQLSTAAATATTGPTVRLSDIALITTTMQEIADMIGNVTGTPPDENITVTLGVVDPSLGRFSPAGDLSSGLVRVAVNAIGTNVTFSSRSATDLAEAIRRNYVFSLSAEAAARGTNFTDLLYVKVDANDDSFTDSGSTAVRMSSLNMNGGPVPIHSGEFVVNISRGLKFSLDDLPVFRHPYGLSMQFGAAQSDGFPLPLTLRVQSQATSGNCTIRGKIDQAEPLKLEIAAGDGYFVSSAFITLQAIVLAIQPNPAVPSPLAPVELRPGRPFQYALPTSLFISSTEITYDAVRLAGSSLPLPITMTFDAPNILRGQYNVPGMLELEVRASDLFGSSRRNFTLDFKNKVPQCSPPKAPPLDWQTSPLNSTSSSSLQQQLFTIEPVNALQPFRRTVELTTLCLDPDDDPLLFSIAAVDIPAWMVTDIRPGILSSLPQTLTVTGTAPKSSVGTFVNLNVTVTDTFAAAAAVVVLSVPLLVRQNVAPQLVTSRALPNFTINPGTSNTWTIELDSFFFDQNDDPLTVVVTASSYAAKWTDTQFDAASRVLRITAAPPDTFSDGNSDEAAQEPDETITLTVSDPFNAQVQGVITVSVRLTLWQKIRLAIIVAGSLLSAALSVLSVFLFYPLLYNIVMGGRKQIECPISCQCTLYHFPEEVVTAETLRRITYDTEQSCLARISLRLKNCVAACNVHLWNELTLEEFSLGDPPTWLQKADGGLRLEPPRLDSSNDVDPNPKYKGCYVRLFSRRGLLVQQFACNYEKCTKGFKFESGGVGEAERGEKGGNNSSSNNNVEMVEILRGDVDVLREKLERLLNGDGNHSNNNDYGPALAATTSYALQASESSVLSDVFEEVDDLDQL